MKYKVGFIGGGINSVVGKVHKIALEMDDRFEVVAGVFSRYKDVNLKSAKIYGIKKAYTKIEDMLEKENLDMICILTPTNRHFEDIKECLKTDINIVSEKTMVTSLNEIKKLESLIKNEKKLFVTYNYTGYPMLREMRKWIKNRKIGHIYHINLFMPQESFLKLVNNSKLIPQDWRRKDYEIPTIYLDLGIHLFSLLKFILDNIEIKYVKTINKKFSSFNVIDDVSSILILDGDIVVNIWFSKIALGHTNGLGIEVYGKEGSLKWYQLEPEYLYYADNKGNKFKLDRGSEYIMEANKERYNRFKVGHPDGYIEAFANYYYDIAEVLDGKDNPYTFGIKDCEEGIMFLDKIFKGELC